ncbi:MAG: hypothetical protein ACLTTQ_07640 [Christensenellales bacterium]
MQRPTRKHGIYEPSTSRGRVEHPTAIGSASSGSAARSRDTTSPSCFVCAKTASLCRKPQPPCATGRSRRSMAITSPSSEHTAAEVV